MTIAAEEPKQQTGRGRRRFFRAFLGCGFFVLVLVTIAAVLILPKTIDEPPFDAPGLELVIPEVPDEENAALAYMAIWEEGVPQLPSENDRVTALWEAVEAGELLSALAEDAQLRDEYWEPMLRMLERIEEAGRLPRVQFPVVTTIDEAASHLGYLRDTAKALYLRSQWFFEKGESENLLKGFEAWARFSRHMSSGVLDPVSLMISVPETRVLCENLGKHLSATSGDLRALLARLREVEYDRKQVSDAVRVDFQIFRNTLADPTYAHTEDRSDFARWLYLPNQTERIYGEALLGEIAEGEATGRVVTPGIELPEIDGYLDRLLVGNVVGWSFIGMMAIHSGPLYEKAGAGASVLRATELMVALVIYEEQHGELPAQLDALVPDIIPAVPRDPFDGKPIRYDRERRVVWCVGADWLDGGGESMPGAWSEEDIVVEIPTRGE